MADQTLTLDGPMEFEGRARVAWDMARFIAGQEKNQERDRDPRKYWLQLYSDCHAAVYGYGGA
jgi:hypothetical protein